VWFRVQNIVTPLPHLDNFTLVKHKFTHRDRFRHLDSHEISEVLKAEIGYYACDNKYVYFSDLTDNGYLYRADLRTGEKLALRISIMY